MIDESLYNTPEILRLLQLEEVGKGHFRGQSLLFMNGRSVFGGQVVAQALRAACATVAERRPHSLHCYFILPGDPSMPIDFEVEQVRDGGSFSVRRVVAHQEERRIFVMSASFQCEEEGLMHQRPMPESSDPETLPSRVKAWRREAMAAGRKFQPVPVEFRIEGEPDVFSKGPHAPHKKIWARAPLALPDDPAVHETLFAYMSDYGLLSTSLQPHGIAMNDRRLQIASLDHAIWFHRPFRFDDWLLFDMESPVAAGGRGLNLAYVYDRHGKLVATIAQEGLIRLRDNTGTGTPS
jgi:acyl-CoA thioesterase-2